MKSTLVEFVLAVVAVFGLTLGQAHADEAILTIEDIDSGEVFQFTDADLSALQQTEYDTSTIWTTGVLRFSGPTVKELLSAIGREPSDLKIYAINDYNVTLPVMEIKSGAPILANRINGESFSVREKGPLWIVFPYDDNRKYRTETIFALSVWQVNRIEILAGD